MAKDKRLLNSSRTIRYNENALKSFNKAFFLYHCTNVKQKRMSNTKSIETNTVKDVLKPVLSIPGMEINSDGSLILFEDKVKNIIIDKPENRSIRKVINHRNKTYIVSRLVFEAWLAPLPYYRNVKYLDGNRLNTHHSNLYPRPISESLCRDFKPVNGLTNVLINNNGSEVYQDGLSISIRGLKKRNGFFSPICVLHTFKGAKYFYVSHLVASAWLNWSGRGVILHLDEKIGNNHFKNLNPVTLKEYKKLMLKKANLPAIRRGTAIPKKDYESVKIRLLMGEPLASIGFDYCCSDMAVHRLKVKLLTKDEINELHKKNNINTEKMPDDVKQAIILELKDGTKKQKEIAAKYNTSPTVVCRIARLNKIKCNPAKFISDEVKKAIKNDAKKYKASHIAENYGVSLSTVYKYS